jgi:hypothetical protein
MVTLHSSSLVPFERFVLERPPSGKNPDDAQLRAHLPERSHAR